MKKKFLIFGGLLVIIALLIFLAISYQHKSELKNLQEQQKTIVRIGQNSKTIFHFPLFVAQEKGIFNECGLEVQLKEVDPSLNIPALLSKDIDYSAFIREGVAASLEGAPIKTIMTFAKSSPFALVAQSNLELKDLKFIGITDLLSPPHYAALKIIEGNNLSAKIIVSGSIPATAALLTQKKVDAVVQSLLSASQLSTKGYNILTLSDDRIPYGLATNDERIKNNSQEIKKVVKAMQSAVKFIKNNPEETKELLFKFVKLEKNEANQKIIEQLYSVLKESFSDETVPSEEGINILIKLGKAGNFETTQDIERQTATNEDIAAAFDFTLAK